MTNWTARTFVSNVCSDHHLIDKPPIGKVNVGVSKNMGNPPKSSIFIGGFHEINHPFWGGKPPIFGSTPMFVFKVVTCLAPFWILSFSLLFGSPPRRGGVVPYDMGSRRGASPRRFTNHTSNNSNGNDTLQQLSLVILLPILIGN